MKAITLLIILLIFTLNFAVAQSEDVSYSQTQPPDIFFDYSKTNLNDMISVKPENIDALRKQMQKIVFGDTELPQQLPYSVYPITDTLYKDISNLKSIEKFIIVQDYNIKSVGYIFKPKKNNMRLFLYHQGHNGDFILGKDVIEFFVNKGFTVYAFCMPLIGKNNQPLVTINKIGTFKLSMEEMESHELMKFLDFPISFFIRPILIMLNYAQNHNFTDITMCGISGGGWTTTIAAALDKRINYSFPVAGTYPIYIKLNSPSNSYGDFEQIYPPLYSKIGYLDMYIMGATGENRFQVQMLNLHDPCCFQGEYYKHYESFVKNKVDDFEYGSFEVISDTQNTEHKISKFLIENINAKLNPETKQNE